MNVMNFVNRYGIISYIVTVVLAIIFNMTGFEIMNITVSNVLNILYSIVLMLFKMDFVLSDKITRIKVKCEGNENR